MCVNPHPRRELNQELLKEEEGLTAHRGLVSSSANPKLADNQAFLMYVTDSIRKTYDAKMLQLVQQVGQGGAWVEQRGSAWPWLQRPTFAQSFTASPKSPFLHRSSPPRGFSPGTLYGNPRAPRPQPHPQWRARAPGLSPRPTLTAGYSLLHAPRPAP